MSKRPALKRRIVLYDLSDQERDQLRAIAEVENRTLSRWCSDAVRDAMKKRAKRLLGGSDDP